jgi:hypothetical protein
VGLEVGTSGAEEFHRLAADLRRAGAKTIQKRLYSALNRSTRPAIAAARASAATTLPRGGGKQKRKTRLRTVSKVTIEGREYRRRRVQKLKGHTDNESLAQRVEQSRFRTRAVKLPGGTVGVQVTATSRKGKGVDLDKLDRGRLRHPLFGDRNLWYDQTVPARWFTRPMEKNADNVEQELKRVVDEIDRDITEGR